MTVSESKELLANSKTFIDFYLSQMEKEGVSLELTEGLRKFIQDYARKSVWLAFAKQKEAIKRLEEEEE